MFIKILTLFTIFGISSLHCMEPEVKISTKKLIKQKSQAILRKLSNEKINEEPATNAIILENPFIIVVHSAIESKNYTAVQFHLRNPLLDPNTTDQQGDSALQIFIKAKACQGIELLLKDHRVQFRREDLFKEFSNQMRIFECLDKSNEDSLSIRQKIFARFTLDLVTHEECQNIEYSYKHGLLTNEILTNTISTIKKRIKSSTDKQIEANAKNHVQAVLSKLAGDLPDYATDEFIEQKIWCILSSMQNTNNI